MNLLDLEIGLNQRGSPFGKCSIPASSTFRANLVWGKCGCLEDWFSQTLRFNHWFMLVGEYRVRQVVGVALWHLEAGVKFRVKIKPQEMQPKMWSTPFWKHELLHWVPNPCSINSQWPGEQSPSLSPSVCPSSRLSCLQISWKLDQIGIGSTQSAVRQVLFGNL